MGRVVRSCVAAVAHNKSSKVAAYRAPQISVLQSLLQIAAVDLPDQVADLAAPRCIPRAHSRCRRPSATVAACPCAARQGMVHALPTSPPDDGAAMVARASIALATTDGVHDAAVDVADAAALPASVMSSSTSSSASCPRRQANTAGHWVRPRMRKTPMPMRQLAAAAVATVDDAVAAADDAAASIADDVAAAAAMWATCPHSVRHTEQMPMSCWAGRDCPGQAARCRLQQRPGWARSGAAMWVSSADTRSASAVCG